MEAAATLQKKKTSINKTKLKKTIKNILCRPDLVFWPAVTVDQGKLLETILCKYKIHIPEFIKPHWKELQSIPKEERPKPPRIEKINGLIFGISECTAAIQGGECTAIIIESTVNPQSIVQPVLETCFNLGVPAICVNSLRKISTTYFGIPTSCLGVKKHCLLDLSSSILELYKDIQPQIKLSVTKIQTNNVVTKSISMTTNMDVVDSTQCPYLFRTNKKIRAFVPPSSENKITKTTKEFIGQDFIEFSDKGDTHANKKGFKKMMVKRISNNPNRSKVK